MPFDNETYRPMPEGHRRLLVLADHIEANVHPHQFRMEMFRNECGTIGCALGHGGSIPEFAALGYECGPWGPMINGERKSNYNDTVAPFFGCKPHQITDLFGTHKMGMTPSEFAARIRAFVAEQAKVLA